MKKSDRPAIRAIARDILAVLPPGFNAVVVVVAPEAGDGSGDAATGLISTLPADVTGSLLEQYLRRAYSGDGAIMSVATVQ